MVGSLVERVERLVAEDAAIAEVAQLLDIAEGCQRMAALALDRARSQGATWNQLEDAAGMPMSTLHRQARRGRIVRR